MAKKTDDKKTTTKKKLASPKISAKMTDVQGKGQLDIPAEGWAIKGELALNCNCTVFCPCVVSLGVHAPTHGYCQAWCGVRIDRGHKDGVDLSGLNVAMLLDIPGRMCEGNWSLGLFIDDGASAAQHDALEQIFSGKAGGTTGLFRLLVGNYLGAERAPVTFTTEGDVRTVSAGRAILGSVVPIPGPEPDKPVTIENTGYWMGSTVKVAKALKGKVRSHGRVWNLDDCSAELCDIRWQG